MVRQFLRFSAALLALVAAGNALALSVTVTGDHRRVTNYSAPGSGYEHYYADSGGAYWLYETSTVGSHESVGPTQVDGSTYEFYADGLTSYFNDGEGYGARSTSYYIIDFVVSEDSTLDLDVSFDLPTGVDRYYFDLVALGGSSPNVDVFNHNSYPSLVGPGQFDLQETVLLDANQEYRLRLAIEDPKGPVFQWNSGTYAMTGTITSSVVPIPAAAWLFGSALVGLGWFRRKLTV